MSDISVIEHQPIPANKPKAAWELLKLTFGDWIDDNAFELSGALAFYTIFSIAPVLLIAVGVASFFLTPDTATDQIVGEMKKMIGAEGANAVRQVIDSSRGFGKGLWAVSVGIVTLILGATAVFGELQSALNQIWDVKAKPDRGVIMSFVVDRVCSFLNCYLRGISSPGFTRNQRTHQRPAKLHEHLVAWCAVGLAHCERCKLVLGNRTSFCRDLQAFAGRPDLVERRMDRSSGDGPSVYRRKIFDRNLSRANRDSQCLWSGGFAGSPVVLGLLLCADQFSRSGVHAGLRAPVWSGYPAEKTCGSCRTQE